MTIVFRNTTITVGVVLAFCITLCISLLLMIFIPQFSGNPRQEVLQVINIFYLGLYAFISALVFRISFSKTLAPEMFFFTVFILTFSFEVPRLLFYFLESQSAPFVFGILVTRVVHFGRFLRIFSIFVVGLFACSSTNPKTGIYLGIGILLSIAYAIGIPVDATEKTGHLLFVMGLEKSTQILFFLGKFFSIVNIILAGILKNTREYYLMAVSMFITLGGTTCLILFPGQLLFLLIGIPLITAGTILFGKQSHDLYLWT